MHLKTRHFRIANSRISSNFRNTCVHRTRSSGLSYKYGDNPTFAFAIPRYSFRRMQLSAGIASALWAKGAKKCTATARVSAEFLLLSRGIKRFWGLFVLPVRSAPVINTNAALVSEWRTDRRCNPPSINSPVSVELGIGSSVPRYTRALSSAS